MKYVPLGIGLMIGNFLYQAFQTNPNWEQAADRSFFQLAALLIAGFL